MNTPGQSSPVRPQALRVLCAEDDTLQREIIWGQIRAFGYHVDFAFDGAEAIEKLRHVDFDVVLMDNRMPVMDGVQATREIRAGAANGRHRDIPIIGLTASASQKSREECLTAGMNALLSKPLDTAELQRALVCAITETSPASHTSNATASPGPVGLTEAELLALVDETTAAPSASAALNPRLVAVYFQETPARFAQMRTALAQRDAVAFARAAHSLKSTSAYAQATELSELGARLESLADEARFTELEAPLARAQLVFAQLQEKARLPLRAPSVSFR